MKKEIKKEREYISFEEYLKNYYPGDSQRNKINDDVSYKFGINLAKRSLERIKV